MMNFDKDPFKSRYRGVYRCGKRWKAQLQSHGIQFYLGMFDTEEEAARAYDRKAREEKSGKNPVNFEVAPEETEHFQHRPSSPSYRYYGGGEEDDNIQFQGDFRQKYGSSGTYLNKRTRSEEDQGTPDHLRRLDYQSTTENMKILWDRHCQIAQRLLLAKAAQSKLAEFQAVAPDTEKETILKALSEEIILLVVVKSQLEEAVSRCYRLGLDLNTSSVPPLATTAKSSNLGQATGSNHQFSAMNGALPPFRSNFSGSNGSNMPPYHFPQLPPFPIGVNSNASGALNAVQSGFNSGTDVNGNPFAPLRKPYVPAGTAAGGYFGHTFPPSALPSLSLPSRSATQPLAQSISVPSSLSHGTQSVSMPTSTSLPGSSREKSLAVVEMTAAMSSFQALTKGPSLLSNTSLLTAPALLDNVLIGNNPLPPPPQVPLPTSTDLPSVALNSSVSGPSLANAVDPVPVMPATYAEKPIVEKQEKEIVPIPLTSSTIDRPADTIESTPSASVQVKPMTSIAQAVHKVEQSPQPSSVNGSAASVASNKRSATAASEQNSSEAAVSKDSPKRSRGATSTGKAASFPGSDHVLFQLSAEQESAIVNAAAAASKSRAGKGAAATQDKLLSDKEKEKGKEKEKEIPAPAVSRRSTSAAVVATVSSTDSKPSKSADNNTTRRSSRR